jgi:hypothetical protein
MKRHRANRAVTSRFLNVIAPLNGTVPFIDQMQALKSEHMTLVFTTVMDERPRRLVDEDEDAEAAPTDRAYSEESASKSTVALADSILTVMKEFDPVLTLKYNKFYIGLSRGDGQPFNFAQFRPKKNHVIFEPKLPQIDDIHEHHREGGFGYPRVQQALGLLPPAPYKG